MQDREWQQAPDRVPVRLSRVESDMRSSSSETRRNKMSVMDTLQLQESS